MKKNGFTLIELLVVIAIIGILASLLLSSIEKAKHKAYGVTCINNQRQLIIGWHLYANENNENIIIAGDARGDGSRPYPNTWVGGMMDFNPNNYSNWDINQDIVKSPLWNYIGHSSKIWRCPEDRSGLIPTEGVWNGHWVPRIRSYAMNIYIGGIPVLEDIPDFANNKIYKKLGDFNNTSKTFILTDMREDSVNTGTFGTSMLGYEDGNLTRYYQDIPAFYHLKAGGISFVDSHVEIHRWLDSRTMVPIIKGEHLPFDIFPCPNNQDVRWLEERATQRR